MREEGVGRGGGERSRANKEEEGGGGRRREERRGREEEGGGGRSRAGAHPWRTRSWTRRRYDPSGGGRSCRGRGTSQSASPAPASGTAAAMAGTHWGSRFRSRSVHFESFLLLPSFLRLGNPCQCARDGIFWRADLLLDLDELVPACERLRK
eukprot:751614-Hanusia_phi.AAC.2